MITATPRYLLDPAWHAERDRLNSLTALYDATTMRLIERLHLPSGARCAEVGAGTGSIAQSLTSRLDGGGTLLAIDTDTRFLEPIASDVLAVRTQDITTTPLAPDAFDLVHARLLLEHLPQRDAVLASLVAALAPGGWLLVEDLDWSTAAVIDPVVPVHERVVDACRTFMCGHGYDAEYGRRLPRALRTTGLVDVGTFAESVQVRADVERGIPQWELLVDQLTPGLLAERRVSAADLAAFRALCHDGSTIFFAPLMVSCWGRRPG